MQRPWSIFFLLTILEGCAALVALLLIPGEGLSVARLGLTVLILLPLVASGWLFFRSLDAGWRANHLDPRKHPGIFRLAGILSLLLLLSSAFILFLLRYFDPEATASYFVRARPALIYLMLISAQTGLWVTTLRNGFHLQALHAGRGILIPTLVGFGIFILLWVIVALTGWGVIKDTSYWGEPGIPILGWQLALTLLVGFGLLIYSSRSTPTKRLDTILPIAIWLIAFALWMSVPLSTLRNSFYAPIQPPYDQPFPASDAAYYDSDAQSLLAGYGYVHAIPSRPFFILFLAGLHALMGQEYARIVLGQTVIFALLPLALYFLGRKMHSRTAGVVVALLAIFREWTSLWAASEARVSNTKMLLSEFITTLVLIAFLLLVMRWFREKRNGPFLAFASGGMLGLQLLLRTQIAFIAPGIILLALLVSRGDWKRWIAQSLLFAAGLILAISPWVLRNYTITGSASLDDPTQIKAVASMYSGGTPTSNYPLFEGQTPEQMSQYVVNVILERPGYVAGFVVNQFFANSIDTLLVLPIFARYDGLSAPIYPYWGEWDTYLSPGNLLLLLLYLGVISVGLAAAWKRLGWAGLLPLVVFVFYAFSTSLARYSGWRYIFPADWVGYFYFGIGAVELFSLILILFGTDAGKVFAEPVPVVDLPPARGWRYAALTGMLLLLGGLPWIAENAIPKVEPICADPIPDCFPAGGVGERQVMDFLSQPNARMLTGSVLYPRYFPRFDGLASTNPVPAFAPRDFPRMGFFLLLRAGDIEQVILPMKGSRPFPHAEEAIILGCVRDTYIEARLVLFPGTGEMFTNGSLEEPCPTP